MRLESLVGEWVQEIEAEMEEDCEWEETEELWGVVNGEAPLPDLVKEGRREEVGYMVGRDARSLKPVKEC